MEKNDQRMDYKERFEKARSLLQKGEFLRATKIFALLAFMGLKNIEKKIDPIQAMQLTVTAYRKWCQKHKIDLPLDPFKKSLVEQYYLVVRHYMDHKKERSAAKIEKEITRQLPLSEAKTNDISLADQKSCLERGFAGPFQTVVVSSQGPREKMEDRHLTLEISIGRESEKIQLFAVFDGHSGEGCAAFVQEYMPQELATAFSKINVASDLQIYNALTETFIHLDERWRNLPFQKTHLRDYSGTTATCAIILRHQHLWIANVGDSRAIITFGEKVLQLSEDAKPTKKKYRNEIYLRGGYVMWGRVDGNLDMARSIGDIAHPSISAHPTLKKLDLAAIPAKAHPLLILACDGLWNVVSPREAALVCRDKMTDQAALELKELAFRRGSFDNVTILLAAINAICKRKRI